jgi:mono/diheme cytochrome c family protein
MGKDGHIRPLEKTQAYSTISRTPPLGTIPQTQSLKSTTAIDIPKRYTKDLLEKGQDLYNVNCMPCHGMSGYGNGMIVKRGFLAPPSYHIDRLRSAPDQHFYEVITHGYGAMYSYADRISSSERWAIIGYIRALQLSQSVNLKELKAEEQKRFADLTTSSQPSSRSQ